MIRVLLCVLAVFASQYAPDVRGSQEKVILVVGDSLSAGHGIAIEQGWVSLLASKIRKNNFRYRLVNASISGDTTANGLTRLQQSLDHHEPAIVVLELGGNDGLRGLSLQATRQNLSAMIEKSQARGASVLLVGIKIPPNYGRRYTQAFYAIYPELAEKYRVALMPFLLKSVATEAHLMQADGIHPNAAAQATIMENVWSYLKPLLLSNR